MNTEEDLRAGQGLAIALLLALQGVIFFVLGLAIGKL